VPQGALQAGLHHGRPDRCPSEQIRAAEAILDRGLGKVVEFPDQRSQPFAFFNEATPEQIALAERLVNALPANTDGPQDTDGNSNGNEAG
jgi:hypothetical protein